MYVHSLNKESTELLTAKDDFKLKEADLIRQVDKLKHQVEELKNNHKEYVASYVYT